MYKVFDINVSTSAYKCQNIYNFADNKDFKAFCEFVISVYSDSVMISEFIFLSLWFLPASPKAKAGLGVQSLRPSVRPSVRPKILSSQLL